MLTRYFIRLALACGLAGLAPALLAAAPPVHANWAIIVTPAPDGGHIIGNPAAKLKLTEYMSYTCSHCAAFESEGMPQLRLTAVAQGKVSVEVRYLMRDPIDATVAQLTACVPPSRFLPLHEDFLHRQDQWLTTAQHATEGQTRRWFSSARVERMRAIAGDLGFYAIMESHGVERIAADHCLANEALTKSNLAQTQAATKLGIPGTPGFVIDGLYLAGTYDWRALQPQLEARM